MHKQSKAAYATSGMWEVHFIVAQPSISSRVRCPTPVASGRCAIWHGSLTLLFVKVTEMREKLILTRLANDETVERQPALERLQEYLI